MDVRYINPFVRSICNTFETMCSLPVAIQQPEIKTDNGPTSDVSSIIGFSGDAAGSVVLHFSFDIASKIATRFAGVEITPDHEDFADAIGELANMVAGGAKAQIESVTISISLPNVIVGHNHSLPASKAAPRIMIPCDTEVGSFSVEIGMILSKQSSGQVAQSAGALS